MTTKRKRPKTQPLNYFFYRGDLHKRLHISRPNDVIVAWNYPEGETRRYVYSDVRRNGAKAFSTSEVSKLINRSKRTIKRAIASGAIHPPQRTYGIDEERNGYAYYWSEKDIMDFWDHLRNVHHGRPRNDGMVTPKDLPTASELRAMIRQGTVFYVESNGKFVPTWKADNI